MDQSARARMEQLLEEAKAEGFDPEKEGVTKNGELSLDIPLRVSNLGFSALHVSAMPIGDEDRSLQLDIVDAALDVIKIGHLGVILGMFSSAVEADLANGDSMDHVRDAMTTMAVDAYDRSRSYLSRLENLMELLGEKFPQVKEAYEAQVDDLNAKRDTETN